MGRNCADCGDWCSNSNFSSNQWRKGEGCSRCRDCVSGGSQYHTTGYAVSAVSYQPDPSYPCVVCNRDFNNQNELNMHMQVHRPRNISCPVCGDTRFRSPANAVQHVESGFCTGCKGTDNARNQIYQYAQRKGGMQQYMDLTPLLTNGGGNNCVPDFPYRCPQCAKSFRHLSQLMQHTDQKHNNMRMLGY
mmetsp:Transcript_28580/g.60956  ORF Transcript_28580/g.60956 Transcript_28580/m.60956 type:complete len:190 (-) Transcript_28580:293-862(-)